MTTDERNRLTLPMGEAKSASLPALVYELSRQLGRAIHHATTPEHAARLEALRKQADDARQLLIATHDELAEMYQTAPAAVEG